ncbi:beta-ketoacyl synthase N-terminal-like domain-containing protein [Sorangium sp. So ce1099]|uniref:beta-ketoacyl synthase N-terminal-like domain-containing protein n=1 Tax=Sorangium sp. So ce1099 TaxID=3133331 RepID=UPI003F6143BB
MSSKQDTGRQSVLRQALLDMKLLRERLDEAERARIEPIAVVGLALRFPGAESPSAFWRLLCEGVDASSEVPRERWDVDALYDPDPNVPGRMYTRRGSFLRDIDRFDARFFNISPREAVSIDPQHRLFWETSWEALERAGRAPGELSGSRTGVFLGMTGDEYYSANLLAGASDPRQLDDYVLTGTLPSVAAGRLSYMLGLQGPSLTLDTACSSSLVAVHLACRSLRSGETDLAIAGGVNLILTPWGSILLSRMRALSPDGRCKSFEQAADGYGRAEGCGVVVLERLSSALQHRSPILAVIRGTAVNQDGPSSGPTVPNGLAQQDLVRQALADAGVTPAEVDYVEAHGTGTSLGDPIEVRALGEVLREGRPPSRPFFLGSVKANIGHCEGAAGMAGLIKTVLSLQHGEIPPQPVREPSRNIPWHEIPARLPASLTPWLPHGERRVAGVSSFGISGTNAHVVLADPPPVEPPDEALPTEPSMPLHVLALSARKEEPLRALASRYEAYFAGSSGVSLADVCFTAGAGRSHFEHRLAALVASPAEAQSRLAAFASGEPAPGIVTGRVRADARPKVAFLFTGQGSHYAGMGRQLYETHLTFQEALDRCDEILRPSLPVRLLDVLYPAEHPAGASLLDDTAYTQPALFAIQYALTELWREWGVDPHAVMGHSVGELSAACVAGVFSLEQGLALAAERGRLMQGLPRDGQMMVIFDGEERVAEAIAPWASQVAIAAVNSPSETVISGSREVVQRVSRQLEGEGVKTRELKASHAFHSPLMAPILDDLERAAAKVDWASPHIKLISNLTGGQASSGELANPLYWRRHAREPVRFAAGIRSLQALGADIFVEIGPKPTLLGIGRRCLPAEVGAWLPSLRDGKGDWQTMLSSLAELYTRGVEIDWRGVYRDAPRSLVVLPTYPFQRERYWFDTSGQDPAAAGRASGPRVSDARGGHPLIGHRVRSPVTVAFEVTLDPKAVSIFRDHRVFGFNVVSGVAHLAMAKAALGEETGAPQALTVADVAFREALVVAEEEPRAVQVVLEHAASGDVSFRLFSADGELGGGPGGWKLHTAGVLRPGSGPAPRSTSSEDSLAGVRARCREEIAGDDFYSMHWSDEHHLGPSFRLVQRVFRRDGESLAELRDPSETGFEAGAYAFAPKALIVEARSLEAAVHSFKAALPGERLRGLSGRTYVALGIERLHQPRAQPGKVRWSHVRIREESEAGDSLVVDVRLLDEREEVVAVVEGLRFWRAASEALRRVVEGKRPDGRGREASVAARPAIQLDATPIAERPALIESYLLDQVSGVVSLPRAEIDPGASLRELGLDSLMAMELKQRIEKELGLAVPVVDLLRGPSPRELAGQIAGASSLASSDGAPPTDTAVDARTKLWFRRRARSSVARLRLFCFPFGGGSDFAYRAWGDALGARVEVCPVKLPGREDRREEPPYESFPPLLDALERAIEPLLDRPFAFFGTSMGGIMGFELARRLEGARGRAPLHLFIAASPPPHGVTLVAESLRHAVDPAASEAARRHALQRLGLMSDSILDHPDLVEALLPVMRADLCLMSSYACAEREPVRCPISVFGGVDDALVRRDALADWSRYSRGELVLRMVPGDHMFVNSAREHVLKAVAQDLARFVELP